MCTRRDPLVVCLELHAKFVIEDPQVAVAAAHDRLRHDRLHFLRHHADIGLVATAVAEAIKAEAIVELTEQSDVMLERNIGSPATLATADAADTPAAAETMTAAQARRSDMPCLSEVRGNRYSAGEAVPARREDAKRLTADAIELAGQHGGYGYRKIAALLRQAGRSAIRGSSSSCSARG